MNAVDTIVIGGGISGLYTAFKLQKANISYLLLESKSNLGGRIAGQPACPHSDLFVDLGPTWFWPHQKRLKLLLTHFDIKWFEQYSTGEALYHMHPEEVPSRISASAGEMKSYRVTGGMQKLIIALTEELEQAAIKTEHAVITIKKQDNIWQVTALHQEQERTFRAHQLVLALPPRLILRYLTPEHYLSKKLINDLQIQQTWMSGQAKFIAVYKKPFWRDHHLSGQAFSRVGPIVEIHDGSSAADSGFALFGFIGLQPDVRSQLSHEQLKSRCITQLGVLFGSEALDAKAVYLKDWAQDKWVATGKDVIESPRHPDFSVMQHKKELESLRLHLVASEFAQHEAGYLEGALMAADTAVSSNNSHHSICRTPKYSHTA